MSDAQGVPRWMAAAVLVLILAIVGVGALLVLRVFTEKDPLPVSAVERDIILYQDKVGKDPQDPQAHGSLAQAYLAAKRYPEALAEADRLIKLQPKNLGGFYLRGLTLRLSGDFDGALEAYDAVLALVPTEAEAMYQKSLVMRAKGDLDGAQKSLEAAVAANPMASDFRVQLGAFYESKGHKEKAVEQYQAALRYVPDYAPALEALRRLGVKAG
ncbi:MAG: tetratricopeptide repeat protein [Thermoleophilia bacterium]|nr:tetratricopeptide repeat protein [Thermoleophilia bacterium]